MVIVSLERRRELAGLARNKKTRAAGPLDTNLGCKWHPTKVISPMSGMPFTEAGAWDLVAELLESAFPIEELTLESPAGMTALVFLVDLPGAQRTLYIKIHPGGRGVFGRSFHYSERAELHGTAWNPSDDESYD